MNRKVITEYQNVKLTHQITTGQYEVVFGTLNVAFNKFDDAAKAFEGICAQNKPSLLKLVSQLVRGKRAA